MTKNVLDITNFYLAPEQDILVIMRFQGEMRVAIKAAMVPFASSTTKMKSTIFSPILGLGQRAAWLYVELEGRAQTDETISSTC